MADTSTKATCLAEMRASFAEVIAVVDAIPRESLTDVGVTAEWSVRDVLAHESGYERWVAATEKLLVEKEILTTDEIDERTAETERRWGGP